MRTNDFLKKTIKHWIKTFWENFLKILKDKSGCIEDVPKKEMKSIAKMLLPNIIAFYETEEGKRVFEEWKKKQSEKASADVA